MAYQLSPSDLIMLGKFPCTEDPRLSEKFLNAFFENVKVKEGCIENFHQAFENCQTNKERVTWVLKYFKWIGVNPSDYTELGKNAKISSELRERGNKCFKDKNWSRTMRAYNLAICFAPVSTEELGLAFANRSALFFEIGDWESCLKDIEFARQNAYPSNMPNKLDNRQKKVITASAVAAMGQSNVDNGGYADELKTYCETKLFGTNKDDLNPSLVEEMISAEFGRHIVASKDLMPGEVVLVEDPYVKILVDELGWDTEHCHYCMKKLDNIHGLPCLNCVFMIYCNEKCRSEAYSKSHQFECACTKFLYLKKLPRYALLTFRSICKAGATNLFKIFLYQTKGGLLNGSHDQLDKEITSYLSICQLIAHEESEHVGSFSNVLQAIILVNCLQIYSSYFTELEHVEEYSREKEKFHVFLIEQMLHHLQSYPYNSISVDELRGLEQVPFNITKESESQVDQANAGGGNSFKQKILRANSFQIGSAIFAKISMLNHSCAPNVTRINDKSNGTIAIVALQKIRNGEQLFTTYTHHFKNSAREDRQNYLAANYNFKCNCTACKERWPILNLLDQQHVDFICNQCWNSTAINSISISSIVLQSESGMPYQCPTCKTRCGKTSFQQEFTSNIDNYFKSYENMLGNKPLEMIPELVKCLEYFQTNVKPPFGKFFTAQDLLKRALDTIVFYSK